MLAVLTGAGLSAAAGLNAYIPFLVVALLARFTDVLTLPASYAWIESWWAIGIASVLLLVEVVLDKVAVVDSINDAVQTLVRPTVGGLIFAATAAAEDVERGSQFLQDNPWVSAVLGVLVAGVVHGGKAAVRPVVDAGSLGMATPVVSTAEDTASFGLALVAVLWPVLVIVLLAVVAGFLGWAFVTFRRRRARRPARGPGGTR